MSETHSILSNIFKRGRLTSPGNSARYCSFKDSCSPSIFHDSGYNESIKDPSFYYTDAECKDQHNETEYSKYLHSSSLCTSVLSPIKHNAILSEGKDANIPRDYCETPKVAKKDSTLRRRLLVSKAASVGTLGCSEKQLSSSANNTKKTCLSHFLSFDERISKHALDSPKEKSYKPLATSTLKIEESNSDCQKLRFMFSQQRTSTIDDSKPKGSLSEPGGLSPIQSKSFTITPNVLTDSTHLYFSNQSSGLIRTSQSSLSTVSDDKFITPINNLVERFNLNTSDTNTPSVKEISDLSLLTPDTSSYNSLGSDKSEDSFSDHEGSFQELLQNRNQSSSNLNSKRKVKKLQRSRRLSTLSERGSQSEKEEDYHSSANSKPKQKDDFINEDNELVFKEDESKYVAPNFGNLSKTPALQVIHEIFMQTRNKRTDKKDLLKKLDGDNLSVLKYIVAQLIGKKMGIEKLDILTELKDRDLKHILATILDILTVESLCSMWKVSKNWREIVVHDKHANRRRKLYIKQLRADAKGCLLDTENAASKFMVTRFALRPIQAQAKSVVLQMHSSLTPIQHCPNLQLRSKPEAYIKVAQTLFSDEALKPCPRCRCPAKYQSLKKRGVCSREDCAFDFCVLCLCAFHGSRDCSSLSSMRQSKKNAPPGSAESKRNLKRL
ncbi:F-box only protein 43 [Ahaetulla prasina]|uniref:F-box only protein 43 n=1 Tax=Ahaetulla prasina TaxID=499056 RepID=UPI0026472AC2|nr:F-box only protein 43 [Ahaetulla prasina]